MIKQLLFIKNGGSALQPLCKSKTIILILDPAQVTHIQLTSRLQKDFLSSVFSRIQAAA